jgi:hypothetical protein
MFLDKHLEGLSTTLATFKKDLQFAQRWAILVLGYADRDGHWVSSLSVGVFLGASLKIKKKMCVGIYSRGSLVDMC